MEKASEPAEKTKTFSSWDTIWKMMSQILTNYLLISKIVG